MDGDDIVMLDVLQIHPGDTVLIGSMWRKVHEVTLNDTEYWGTQITFNTGFVWDGIHLEELFSTMPHDGKER